MSERLPLLHRVATPLWVVLLLAGLWVTDARAAAGADAAVVLVSPAPDVLGVAGRRGKKVSVRTVDDAERGKVFEVTWTPGCRRLAELLVKSRPPLYAFDKGVVVSIPVHNGGWPALRTVGVRVIDAYGETWQWGTKVRGDTDSWQVAKVDLAPDKNTGHWGGKSTGRGKIDAPVRLLAVLAMAPGDAGQPQSIWFGTVSRNAFKAADIEQAFALSKLEGRVLLPEMPIRMVTPATRNDARAVVRNTSDEPIAFGLAVELVSHDGKGTTWKAPRLITLAPGASHEHALADRLTRLGWWRARILVTSADGTASAVRSSSAFVHIDPTGPRKHPPPEGFWFGIDARFKDAQREAWQVEACSLIGADYLRAGLTWPRIQGRGPEGGSWARHRALLELVQKHGMKTSYGLSFTPAWAVREAYKGKQGSYPPRPDAWRAFAGEVARFNRNHGVISYEVWNEPDLYGFWKGTTEEYLETLRIAYEELQKNHPEATVISGGMATVLGHSGHGNNPKLIERTTVDGQDCYEAIGHHEHGAFDRFARALNGPMAGYRRRLRTVKPLWFTETGCTIAAASGPVQQACELVKKHAYARTRNTRGFTWFVFRLGHEGGYSMVNEDREPTPLVAAYNAMTRLMRNKRFVRSHDLGPGNWLIEFAGEGEHLWVAWDQDPRTTGAVVPIRLADGAEAQLLDIFGNGTVVPIGGGLLRLAIEPAVRYLRVRSSARPEVLPAVARLVGEALGEAGKPVTVKVQLCSPLDREATFRLAWQATGGKPAKEVVRVPADGSAKASYRFTAPPGAKAGEAAPTVRLEYGIDGTAWHGRLETPVHVAQRIPKAPLANRKPDFVLRTRPQVFNPNENDPTRKALAWSGPADLSAEVWLAIEAEQFVLRVDVRDDVHRAAASPAMMWKGDSVQFALAVPGQDGFWELGVGKSDAGAMVYAWSAPAGQADPAPRARASAEAIEGGLRYTVRLPLAAMGLSAEQLRARPVRFNLLVNDDDRGQREGWVEIAPHFGKDKDPTKFPLIRFE